MSEENRKDNFYTEKKLLGKKLFADNEESEDSDSNEEQAVHSYEDRSSRSGSLPWAVEHGRMSLEAFIGVDQDNSSKWMFSTSATAGAVQEEARPRELGTARGFGPSTVEAQNPQGSTSGNGHVRNPTLVSETPRPSTQHSFYNNSPAPNTNSGRKDGEIKRPIFRIPSHNFYIPQLPLFNNDKLIRFIGQEETPPVEFYDSGEAYLVEDTASGTQLQMRSVHGLTRQNGKKRASAAAGSAATAQPPSDGDEIPTKKQKTSEEASSSAGDPMATDDKKNEAKEPAEGSQAVGEKEVGEEAANLDEPANNTDDPKLAKKKASQEVGGSDDPEEPEQNNPEKPEQNDPENPEQNDPENPEQNDPEKPEQNDPEKPEQNDPEKPEQNDPEKPEQNDAEEEEELSVSVGEIIEAFMEEAGMEEI